MAKLIKIHLLILFIAISNALFAQQETDTIVLKDIVWDKTAPAGLIELTIPSGNVLMQGFIYKANGAGKHPTLLLLHGFPGNERNLDLAQVVRAHGWNVIYFNYRGSWGSQGKFSFANCVEDVINVVAFCKKYSDSLKIDVSNIVLFGHSMGGWVCLKALERLPDVKKGFALSTWDIYEDMKKIKTEEQLESAIKHHLLPGYFVLNTSTTDLFKPVIQHRVDYDLKKGIEGLARKQVVMLDEHTMNKQFAGTLQHANLSYFDYNVWNTDHPFTNKRVALMKKLLAFLDQ